MTPVALALVLASAVAHATWNLMAKRVARGLAFNWLFDAVSVALYAPLALGAALAERPTVGPLEVVFVVGSALLHLAYFALLLRGYRSGDLSVVYPLARGVGPMLSTLAAVALLGERPTPGALVGAVFIGAGVVVLTGSPRRLTEPTSGRPVLYALTTGGLIAAYTLWDKHAVTLGRLSPLVYFWGFTAVRAALLTPVALRCWDEVRVTWRWHRREAIGVGILSPLSYVLVLSALAVSPVSYVAPAREIGILLGAAMGSRLLAEGHGPRRLSAAAAMVVGVALLATH